MVIKMKNINANVISGWSIVIPKTTSVGQDQEIKFSWHVQSIRFSISANQIY